MPRQISVGIKQKITPFLWYEDQAEQAAKFYTEIFKDGKITHVTKGPDGKTMWVSFELFGLQYYALNGGPNYKFTEAISFFVTCEDQQEVDYYWDKFISSGGQESQCGWLKDKFGLSWQIIPKALNELLGKDKTGKVMEAMMKMVKIEVKELEKAYNGQ